MKNLLLPLFALLAVSAFAQSEDSYYPYNPDYDGDTVIGTPDLLGFLVVYGEAYLPDGVLPIENGGTGEDSVEGIRSALGITVFEDVTPAGEQNSSGIVQGDIEITGKFVQGYGCTATGSFAHASGRNNTASGFYSNATNQNCTATGICSSAEGEGTTASSTAAHAEGFLTVASGIGAHAEGYQTETSANYSHSEGYQTEATNTAAHAEGWNTVASGLYSHAENRNTIANSTCAHAEGEGTSALADAAHSEGFQSVATGFASHAEGYQTESIGSYSHAAGRGSVATATASSAVGYNLIADQDYSSVVGQYNEADRDGTLFVVGAGENDSERANAFEVSAGGALLNGDLEVSGNINMNGTNLLQVIAGLQAQIDALQAELDGMLGGEQAILHQDYLACARWTWLATQQQIQLARLVSHISQS